MRRLALLALLVSSGCDGDGPSDAGARSDAATGSDAGARDAGGGGGEDAGRGDAAAPAALRVLVFTRTTGFRHDSIEDGVAALEAVAAARGWTIDDTGDAAQISTARLATVDVLVFLSTTGDPLDATQEAALEAFVRDGGGWVGVHAAADCEYDWPFYGELVGAWFASHPAIQDATLVVEDRDHPATAHLDATWMRRDEWYDFRRNPRADVRVLITIDESTYSGGSMGADHPMTWAHEVGAGRSFYTALGHTRETFAEPAFRALLAGAVEWAGRR
ncbi:MAG: ThuA domain-containing protein [Sandaracinaceae bacterium]|nr:ThuA domain-containing protein [Sandaracinaceae bacterium]